MNLPTNRKNNIWAIIGLIFTTIIGPIIVWNFQQGKIENFKLQIETERLQLEKNKQTVEMFEQLSKLLAEQRDIYDSYTKLVQSGLSVGDFQVRRKSDQIAEKDQEIENVKKILSKMTGKKYEYIVGDRPPLPPSGLKIISEVKP